MKVVSKIPMLLVLLVGLFLLGSPNSQATDVWVAQNSNGIDIYVIVNVNIRMYNFDDVQCTVIPSVAYGFVTGMNLQLC